MPPPLAKPLPLPGLLNKMREEWDLRARENARFFIATGNANWTDDEFFASGRQNVAEQILTDMINICGDRHPQEMTVLEIGCGAGRITRALAEIFGRVLGVDVSGEMVAQARQALADKPNAFVFQNNGADLAVLGDVQVDFAFSYIVFQHIGNRDVIESYVREVHRILRPGGLFKLQVQGGTGMDHDPNETWLGAPFSDAEAAAMAERCGFEPRHRHGADTQYFWLWFFKKP